VPLGGGEIGGEKNSSTETSANSNRGGERNSPPEDERKGKKTNLKFFVQSILCLNSPLRIVFHCILQNLLFCTALFSTLL